MIKKILIATLAALCVFSCSPKIIEHVRTEKEYVYSERVDTTFVKDSVYIKEQIKGDTIRIIEYRDRYKYQYKMLRDTLAVHDTTIVERTKEVKVEKPLSFGQKAKIGAFWWLLLATVGLLVWTFRKPILALLKKLI